MIVFIVNYYLLTRVMRVIYWFNLCSGWARLSFHNGKLLQNKTSITCQSFR